MKKIIIVTLAILSVLSATNLSAQNRFEIGVGYAPLFLMSVDDGVQFNSKYDAYFEWRLDLGKHFDVGAKLDYKVCPVSAFDMVATGYSGVLHCASLLTIADFSCLPGKAVNPFIGIGAGPALTLTHWTSRETRTGEPLPSDYYEHLGPLKAIPGFALIVSPRIGVELFNHLRLSTSVDASFNNLIRWPVCINVGWVF